MSLELDPVGYDMRVSESSSVPVQGQDLEARLLQAALPSGGWPYRQGLTARIEPTVWALIALSSAAGAPAADAACAGAWSWLGSLQRVDGLIVEPSTPGPNYGWNGLVLLAAAAVAESDNSDMRRRLTDGLLAVKGIRLDDTASRVRQDNTLQAWSWTEGTFSWVEPTAYCLLAIKKARVQSDAAVARVAEAEAVLFDRVCDGGGWNYGNAQVLGQDLRPYVPTTALALVALQDKPAHPAVEASLSWLMAHAASERSSMALSLAAVALAVFQRPYSEVLEALAERPARSGLLGSIHLTALSLCAATLDQHRARVFSLS